MSARPIPRLTPAMMRLAAHLLENAAEEYANHGCNDLDLAAIKGFETHEARVRLDLAAHVWNGDPKEHDPKMVTTNGHDAFLMGFLADVLRAEAEEASS